MKIRSFAAAVTAASLVALPVAAQAGTSAASMAAPVSYGAHSTASVAKKNNANGSTVLLIAAGLAAAGAGIYLATKKNNDRTPGAQL